MAERRKPKSSPPTQRARGRAADTMDRLAVLERERDQLKAELTAAEQRIKELEESRHEAVKRIDRVLDSLHNLASQAS
jgi:chromosome segregation ATPase